jgi:peptidoglycan hydrolase CwlO-like protein
MCGNRVEELEARVQELEASVEGLTDELVECKVRLRELENAVDDELGFVPETAGEESAAVETAQADKSPDTAEATKSEAHDEEDNTEETEDGIIIA